MDRKFNVEDRVSIIIPIYNGDRFIGKCLDSLINQIYDNIEIVVVNDGCTDQSIPICIDKLSNSRRLYHIYNTLGPSHCTPNTINWPRQVGLMNSTGEYAQLLSCDNWVDTDFCSKLVTMMKDTGNLSSCSRVNFTDSNCNVIQSVNQDMNNILYNYSIGNTNHTGCIIMDSIIFRKDIFLKSQLHQIMHYPENGTTVRLYSWSNIDYIDDTNTYFMRRPDSIEHWGNKGVTNHWNSIGYEEAEAMWGGKYCYAPWSPDEEHQYTLSLLRNRFGDNTRL
jgi:glycosyltransferase involved in cell wall biosynthesis